MMRDLFLIFSLGFLGSFGHCVGMCGPITVALALSKQADPSRDASNPKSPVSNKIVSNKIISSKIISNKISPSIPPGQSVRLPECESSPCHSSSVRANLRTEERSGESLGESLGEPSGKHSGKPSGESSGKSSGESSGNRSYPSTQKLPPPSPSLWHQIRFHLLLNFGRLLSYALVGAMIGAIGSVLVAGGQVMGVGSGLRRGITVLTGLLLIWFGMVQINPMALPRLPLLNPMHSQGLHQRLQGAMARLSLQSSLWTPLLLGLVWGLIPCGFLYAAQLKAAATANMGWGGATLLAFGLGTMPSMVGIGLVSTWLGSDRRHQLFRMGGWLTLLIGVLTLLRTGSQMVDYSGHGGLLCLVLALLARPIGRLWPTLLHYRRAIGVGAFVLSVAHVLHMLEHAWSWNPQALFFMLPQHQWGIGFGIGAMVLMTPLMVTSFDWAQKWLGRQWRQLHLLSIPALVLVVVHCLLVGSHYLGRVQLTWVNGMMITLLLSAVCGVGLVRSRSVWCWLAMEKWYVPPKK